MKIITCELETQKASQIFKESKLFKMSLNDKSLEMKLISIPSSTYLAQSFQSVRQH